MAGTTRADCRCRCAGGQDRHRLRHYLAEL